MSDTPERKRTTGMSVREAGQKGGETVKQKYGPEFYEAMGRKGGLATKSPTAMSSTSKFERKVERRAAKPRAIATAQISTNESDKKVARKLNNSSKKASAQPQKPASVKLANAIGRPIAAGAIFVFMLATGAGTVGALPVHPPLRRRLQARPPADRRFQATSCPSTQYDLRIGRYDLVKGLQQG